MFCHANYNAVQKYLIISVLYCSLLSVVINLVRDVLGRTSETMVSRAVCRLDPCRPIHQSTTVALLLLP